MAKAILARLQKEIKRKKNNVIPLIIPEYYCDNPPRKNCLAPYFCFLDDESCYENDKDFFFRKSKEKIDQISEKYAAIAIEMNCDCQYQTIKRIAGYAKQKGLITIGMHTLFGSMEYMRWLAQKDSNIDIIELRGKEDIVEYDQMLIDIKKNNKAIIIPYPTKYTENETLNGENYCPHSTDYIRAEEKMRKLQEEELKTLYNKYVTGYDNYPGFKTSIEYLYEDRIQFIRANGKLEDAYARVQSEKENYNVGIILNTHSYSEIM